MPTSAFVYGSTPRLSADWRRRPQCDGVGDWDLVEAVHTGHFFNQVNFTIHIKTVAGRSGQRSRHLEVGARNLSDRAIRTFLDQRFQRQ